MTTVPTLPVLLTDVDTQPHFIDATVPALESVPFQSFFSLFFFQKKNNISTLALPDDPQPGLA